jgi:hypothetical protein
MMSLLLPVPQCQLLLLRLLSRVLWQQWQLLLQL